jgi:hypothetical protein
MVIQKHFDLDNTEMWLNLAEYIYENVEYVEQITDKPMRFMEYTQTKYFEMIMYWTVYHFEQQIKDIVKLQQFIMKLVDEDVFFNKIEFLIKGYLNDQSSI